MQNKIFSNFFICFPVFASDKLIIESWPEKQKCNSCATVQVYGLKMKVKRPIENIAMIPSLGLNIKLKNKKFFFSTPPETSLKLIKNKLKAKNWIEYHELIAVKSQDQKIEQLRSALEITTAKGFYKFANKKYTVFYIDRLKTPLATPSEVIIIPSNGSGVVKIGGNINKDDVILMLGDLG